MRKYKYIILFLAIQIQLMGQNSPVRIDLNNVDLAEEPLTMERYLSVIEKRVGYKLESYEFEKASDSLVYTNLHPMVAALHYSFADHRPVVISPDMIWLLITQSFAIHLDQNPEKYKELIVDFKDKKTIKIVRNDFRKGNIENPWHEIFPVFSDSIKKYIGDSLYKTLIPTFSTTGLAEKSAFEISLMDATSNYFDYDFYTFCGIPYIILQGAPSDWKWIADNLDFLNSYDLGFWVDRLKPIIHKIYQSSQGSHDIDFWKNMYKWHEASGGNVINGWIADFFLYTKQSNKYKLNELLLIPLDSLLAEASDRYVMPRGIYGNEFPSGLSKVDFTWFDPVKPVNTFEMSFFAGFMGIKQNRNTLEIEPEISYAIVYQKSLRLKTEKLTIIDKRQPSCNSFLYHTKGINQLPIFHSDKNYNDYRKSEKAFEDYLNQNVNEYFPSKREKLYFTITFTVTKTGETKDIKIESSADKSIINYVKTLITETKDWKPAIINGNREDYELKITVWI